MYLEMIKPFVMFDKTAMREGKPLLEVRVWLRCPFCFGVTEYTGPRTPLRTELWKDKEKKTDDLVKGYRHESLQNLKQHRACEECGMLSAWPKKDQEKGEQALDKAITLEWLRERVEAMGSCVQYKAFLDVGVQERATKQTEQIRGEMDLD